MFTKRMNPPDKEGPSLRRNVLASNPKDGDFVVFYTADSTGQRNRKGWSRAIPITRVVIASGSFLLVGCGGKSSDSSGHGWGFIVLFLILVWLGHRVARRDAGMSFGRFCTWMVWNFVVWHGMSWTFKEGGRLFHSAGDAEESLAGFARDGENEPKPTADLPSADSEKTTSKSQQAAPRKELLSPSPAPNEASVDTLPGGEAMRILREAHAPLSSQGQELDFLEKRTGEIEFALLDGLRKAIDGTHPVENLNHMVEELKLLSASLKDPMAFPFSKSLAMLREELGKKRGEFEEKSRTVATGKGIYMDMLREIGPMQNRADELHVRLQSLKHDASALAQEAAGWIELYRDTLSFKGESAARHELTDLLREKEKSISPNSHTSQ